MQHDYIISNQSGSGFRSDLNSALSAIATQNSGSTAPSTTYAYQMWADSASGLLYRRNAANSGWILDVALSGTHVYTNYLTQRVDNDVLCLFGGFTGGANIELYGPSHATSANNANYDATQHFIRSVDGATQYARFHANGLEVGPAGTDTCELQLGANPSGNRYAYIDLIGDTTFTDYGLRIIRNNTGPNTTSEILHRGTGYFTINAQDGGNIALQTGGVTRLDISGATGLVTALNGLSGAVTRTAAVATGSGVGTVSFTSIPSWVKVIRVVLSAVQLSGTDNLMIQMSTNNGSSYVTTGYKSGTGYTDTVANTVSGVGSTAGDAGFIVGLGNSANIQNGVYTFTNITGNTWIGTYNGVYNNDARYVSYGAGRIALAATLNAIRIVPVGINNYAGSGHINITYEG